MSASPTIAPYSTPDATNLSLSLSLNVTLSSSPSNLQSPISAPRYEKSFMWTVTLLVASTGTSTGFYQWGGTKPADGAGGDGRQPGGVISYDQAGVGVLFPSLAWHRTVIPSEARW